MPKKKSLLLWGILVLLLVAFGTTVRADEKLKTNPDDPQANLALGRYRCFAKGDWEAGLPLLAKSGDAALASLAKKALEAR